MVNNNDRPLQSVFHFHIHLIPRYEDDGMILSTINNYGETSKEEFDSMVAKIKENI
jgi:histidine triad (HIT) family protein